MANLFIVATPIGNLKDITLRALETLKSADLILAEDTRVTKKLLTHYGISRPLFAYNEHTHTRLLPKIERFLKEGKDIALVTDAGTPGISDPGRRLVNHMAHKFPQAPIVPIPGPSALSAIISISDIGLSEFLFVGYPPHKKGRLKFFKRIAASGVPVILFESPHRISRTLGELYAAAGERSVTIGRELTKIYEEIFRGRLSQTLDLFREERAKGEFTLVVGGQ